MDLVDKKLLFLLQEDGRTSCDSLSTEVGLSVSAVSERIKKLQKHKIITGWEARINPKKVGLELLAFVEIAIDGQVNTRLFLEQMEAIPEILECHHMTGGWSYLLKVRCKNTDHFENVLTKIKTATGVSRTHTSIALSSPVDRTKLPMEENGN